MDKKSLEYKLYFRSEEFTNKFNERIEHEKLKSFDDLVEDALNEVVDTIYKLANEKGFYHADQINLKVNIEYQENEG